MGLAIVAAGISRVLPDSVADQLIDRVGRGGLVERNPETGDIVNRSPMAELAEGLKRARASDAAYVPRPDEQALLFAVLDMWLGDVTTRHYPDAAMVLRYALFSDIDDRHRQDPTASS